MLQIRFLNLCRCRYSSAGRASFQRSLKEVQLSDVGSNPCHGIRQQEKILAVPSMGKHEIKFAAQEKCRKKKKLIFLFCSFSFKLVDLISLAVVKLASAKIFGTGAKPEATEEQKNPMKVHLANKCHQEESYKLTKNGRHEKSPNEKSPTVGKS